MGTRPLGFSGPMGTDRLPTNIDDYENSADDGVVPVMPTVSDLGIERVSPDTFSREGQAAHLLRQAIDIRLPSALSAGDLDIVRIDNQLQHFLRLLMDDSTGPCSTIVGAAALTVS